MLSYDVMRGVALHLLHDCRSIVPILFSLHFLPFQMRLEEGGGGGGGQLSGFMSAAAAIASAAGANVGGGGGGRIGSAGAADVVVVGGGGGEGLKVKNHEMLNQVSFFCHL